MANKLAVRPIVIDTAMASDWLTLVSGVAGLERPLKVQAVLWVNPGASAAFTITDGSSAANVLLTGTANSPTNDVQYMFPMSQLWRNFKVTAIAAGSKLLIYTEN